MSDSKQGLSHSRLSFVWAVRDAEKGMGSQSREAGVGCILDLASQTIPSCAEALRSTGADSILISLRQFMDRTLNEALSGTPVRRLWIECPPVIPPAERGSFLQRLREESGRLECVPITGDVELLEALIGQNSLPKTLALKGSEAAGFGSRETAAVLLSSMLHGLGARRADVSLILWGGLATPEAAAAYLSTGAAGIVFESVHWLTDEADLNPKARQALTKLRPDWTRTVGHEIGLSCRLFDRGNSPVVKELNREAHGLCGKDVSVDVREGFVRRVMEASVSARDSGFARQELIPLGPEAAFAASFVERFGSSFVAAAKGFALETDRLCREADAAEKRFLTGPAVRELGSRYPLIQGAMSWISDVPEFARAVADAGALPTLALGLRNRAQLDKDLAGTRDAMGDRPYALNVIVLPENPYRDEQLAWIEQIRPPFAVIAAGDPSYAQRLREKGIEAIYLAPDEGLARLALQAGVRYLVLEGHEAGGHIGQHSLLTLVQSVREMKRKEPELFGDARLVLAGGIVNRDSARRAILLGADALQMGTAYLATKEIVATGAMSPLYQEMVLGSLPGGTVVLGESVGLRIRALRTPMAESVLDIERRFKGGQADENTFRMELEQQAAGSLLVASRGRRHPEGAPLDAETCRREGQFMSGAAAGCLDKVRSLADLHREVAGESAGVSTAVRATVSRTAGPAESARYHERVAITGMAQVNALGNSPQAVFEEALKMKSGIVTVPLSKWPHDKIYDPKPRVPGKTYCHVGAFQNLEITRKDLDMAPQDFRTLSQATRLTLWLARQALDESGLLDSDIPRERISVLVSQNSGEAASTMGDLILTTAAGWLAHSLGERLSLTAEQIAAAEETIKAGRLAIDDTTLLGRLNCTAGGFICNQYGFMGPSYSVSAACATSLVALYSAIQMIRTGVIDAAVVGGGEERLTPAHYLEFSAIGALAGLLGRDGSPAESSRPFDALRDGMVLGEGGGMIVIERESVARRRGAAVQAYITGVGASNSHRGMVESLAETQEIAIRSSFRDVWYAPDTVDLVECHATGTLQGDGEEVKALKTFYPEGRRTVLTSFKSQIGHTLGASGLNNLVRGVRAMQKGVYPGTLNYRNPDPRIDLERWGFVVPREPEDWPAPKDRPRRFQVDAFGFGGANYVIQLEENAEGRGVVHVPPTRSDGEIQPVELSGPREFEGIVPARVLVRGQVWRMAARSDAAGGLRDQAKQLKGDAASVTSRTLQGLSRRGIFAAPEAMPPPPLAFMFAGQGAHYSGMGRELYETFPVVREWMDRIAKAADFDLLELLFRSKEEDLRKTRWQQPALFTLECSVAQYLMSLGIRPVAMAGHSLGELSALCMAGVFSCEDGFRLVNKRAECMGRACAPGVDPGTMMAVNVPMDVLEKKLLGRVGVYFTNFNSPRQVVVGGGTQEILALKEALVQEGFWTHPLKVSMAFHSPIMRAIHDELEAFLAGIEFHAPSIPVISNTTMRPFPDDPVEIKRIVMKHLESPVHWTQDVRSLWNDYAIRLFVEIGPKDVLCGLVTETFEEALCIPVCQPEQEAGTCRAALARLYAWGHLTSPVPPRQITVIGRDSRQEKRTGSGSAAADDYVERIIGIIMDATGYERDEIEPDMDIRADLAIRSSRLPIIIDAAEKQFGITVRLEDFIAVRTVRDLADRVETVVKRDGVVPPPAGSAAAVSASVAASDSSAEAPAAAPLLPIRRLVFREAPLEPTDLAPWTGKKGSAVAVLNVGSDGKLSQDLAGHLAKRYGARVETLTLNDGAARLSGIASLAGLVVALDGETRETIGGPERIPALLTDLFTALQTLMASPAKEFCLLVRRSSSTSSDVADAVAEGVLGMFLAAAQEYASVSFRSVTLDGLTSPETALDRGLDTRPSLIELILRDGRAFTREATPQSQAVEPDRLSLEPGDVVVLSGGGQGVTAHIAEALAPFRPRLILLGRTTLDPSMNDEKLLKADGASENRLAKKWEEEAQPGLKPDERDRAVGTLKAGLEISRTLRKLTDLGVQAEYHTCDVADAEKTEAVLNAVVAVHGRIDGIIHGAGMLRDSFLALMPPAQFRCVQDVKILGLWNLYRAARERGLRFLAGLSSVAAAQGNMGQVNYCAANRAMAALIRAWSSGDRPIRGRTVWLPPIEGAGMADQADVRDLLKLRGMDKAYVHVDEMAEWFCRDLVLGARDEVDVMPVRLLPSVKGTRLELVGDPAQPDRLETPRGQTFRRADIPMLDRIRSLDLRRSELTAERMISVRTDPWIVDHRPFVFLKHPLVSGIMAVETFLETAYVLYPHLMAAELRKVEFRDVLECPAEGERQAEILCRRLSVGPEGVVCRVTLSSADVSPSGKTLDRRSVNFEGDVHLSGTGTPGPFREFAAIRADELDTRPMPHAEVLEKYGTRGALTGRYRVIDSFDGTGPGLVRGRMEYRERGDFGGLPNACYRYSPYVLEALMQVGYFCVGMRNEGEQRTMIPIRIDRLIPIRKALQGECLILEARMRNESPESHVWDARALDEAGRTVMQVEGIFMKWFSP